MYGRSYTMKEMRDIVEYLRDRKAYSDIRGRKMWMDYAALGITSRTWQSLKETFLKRILPDLNNPYYKLTQDEIRSFRQGQDLTNKLRNKLEFHSTSEDASDDKTKKASASRNNKEKTNKGEKADLNNRSDRDSVETVIITEPTPNSQDKSPESTPMKSLRDQITYMEPLTPLMQIMNDFDTDLEENTKDTTTKSPKKTNNETEISEVQKESEKESSEIIEVESNNISINGKKDDELNNITENGKDDNNHTDSVKRPRKRNINSKDSEMNISDILADNGKSKQKKQNLSLRKQNENSKARDSNEPLSSTNDTQLPNNQEQMIKSNDSKNKKRRLRSEKDGPSELSDSNEVQIREVVADVHREETNTNINQLTEQSVVGNIANTQTTTSPNLCLQSVSLYVHSDESDIQMVPEKDEKYKGNSDKVLILASCSEDELKNSVVPEANIESANRPVMKKKKVLDNLFGKSSDSVHKRNKKRSGMLRYVDVSSDSSEWTSESESEFVSPPRARNRYSRKYMKPHSARILSLNREGGLFVTHGKKVFPLIKDGNQVKNFVALLEKSDSEEDGENYWKLKYVEERKKRIELSKLLQENANDKNNVISSTNSPILPSTKPKSHKTPQRADHIREECLNGTEIVPMSKQIVNVEAPKEKNIKIKLAKDEKELQLEGNWDNLQHILPEILQYFGAKKPEDSKSSKTVSEASTPIIIEKDDVQPVRNTEKLEEEIFKEILERDKNETDSSERGEPKVTLRKRGRPNKSPSVTPAKKTRNSNQKEVVVPQEDKSEEKESVNNEIQHKDAQEEVERPSRPSRSSRKISKEPAPIENGDTLDDENILYRFPSPTFDEQNTKRSKKIPKIKSKANKNEDPKIYSPESTQGYQDSDETFITERKKKKSFTNHSSKTRYTRGLRKMSYEHRDASDESSNSLPSIIVKHVDTEHSSGEVSDIAITDSYRHLFPNYKDIKENRRLAGRLDKIDETSPCPNEVDSECGKNSVQMSPLSQNMDTKSISSGHLSIITNTDLGNSSNISLPTSPELSIVENISISKEIFKEVSIEPPTINEIQANDVEMPTVHEKYHLSRIDVSVPLMEQVCQFRMTRRRDDASDMSVETGSQTISTENDDLQGKIDPISMTLKDAFLTENKAMDIANDTITPSIGKRLKNIFLDSGKKKVENQEKKTKKNEDKPKRNKRCSTPNKKSTSLKSLLQADNNAIEEQMEFCTSGRKSCPPLFHNLPAETDTSAPKNKERKKPKPRTKQKKDVIKVKIVRPKNKKIKKRASALSVQTDSGIDDTTTSATLEKLSDKVDLIHNHSETCMKMDDCLGASLEIVEDSASIISVNSSIEISMSLDGLASELHSSDARDSSDHIRELFQSQSVSPNETDYHTPPASVSSLNSLMTEDLSEELSPKITTDWFLLSEEENTTSNPSLINAVRKSTFLSNLKKIFPVACAVPNLSTISEVSKDADTNSQTPKRTY